MEITQNDTVVTAKRLCRIDLIATEEGYPVYKKVGFEDKTQKYLDMRLKL